MKRKQAERTQEEQAGIDFAVAIAELVADQIYDGILDPATLDYTEEEEQS